MFSQTSFSQMRKLIESLKRYNRYDLKDEDDNSLIEQVYVDQLPDEGVLQLALNDNTCFFIGRKGTGKSTVFLVAQERIRKTNNRLAVYLDIKSVFAQAQLSRLEIKKYTDALGEEAIDTLNTYLLHKAFIGQFLKELIVEMSKYIRLGLMERLFSDREAEIQNALDQLTAWGEHVLNTDSYRDIPLFIEAKIAEKGLLKHQASTSEAVEIKGESCFSLSQVASKLGFNIKSKASNNITEESSHELHKEFKDILTLYFDVKSLLGPIADLLKNAGFKRTYIFLDDFSEVEEETTLKTMVDVLIAPLNNWSNDFFKYKIAAYPGRVYYGIIDKSKIDEISLDFYDIYASKKLPDLEQKAIDYTQRMLDKRSQVFLSIDFLDYVDPVFRSTFYEELFKATMNNPRRIGYLLHYCFNNQIVHGHRITTTAFKEAAIKLYREKDEPVFSQNVKIQQAFGERLMVQSQRELLQAIVSKAKDLAKKLPIDGSELFKKQKQIFTSHFFIHRDFEYLLLTLEHNFFVTKYHEQADRSGKDITIYSLNYGLCQREGILLGRPEKTDQGKYYTERAFNYLPTIQEFLKKFITIKCNNCGKEYPTEQLQALKLYDMLCYACKKGNCELSLGYKALVEEIEERYRAIQLPQLDFEILKTINDNPTDDWYPTVLAEEIDTNYRVISRHAEKLIRAGLLMKERKVIKSKGRPVYSLTTEASNTYFSDSPSSLHQE